MPMAVTGVSLDNREYGEHQNRLHCTEPISSAGHSQVTAIVTVRPVYCILLAERSTRVEAQMLTCIFNMQ